MSATAPWMIFVPGFHGSWEERLGHPLRGPAVLDAENGEQAIRAFAEREDIDSTGLAATPAQGHRT